MDIHKQKSKLLRRRAELLGDVVQIEHALDAPMPKDWEDRASERQGDEVLEAIGQTDLAVLKRIDAALIRIENETYGRCMSCGEAISDARLDTVPETALCRYCA